jgi:hypothetical protein
MPSIYRKFLISTMSLVAETRYTAMVPSREMAKLLIKFDLKFVNCFGAVPSIGWVQTLTLHPPAGRPRAAAKDKSYQIPQKARA